MIFLTPYNAPPLTDDEPTRNVMASPKGTAKAARDSEKNKQKKA
ncbi:hypothetical protein [Providencia manganoxydans]